MSHTEVNECKSMTNVLICEERHALHRINDKSHCEVQVYTHQNNFNNFCEFQTFHQNQIWIEIHKPNNWFNLKTN